MRGVQMLSQNIALNLSCTGHLPFVHNLLLGAGLFEDGKTAAAKVDQFCLRRCSPVF